MDTNNPETEGKTPETDTTTKTQTEQPQTEILAQVACCECNTAYPVEEMKSLDFRFLASIVRAKRGVEADAYIQFTVGEMIDNAFCAPCANEEGKVCWPLVGAIERVQRKFQDPSKPINGKGEPAEDNDPEAQVEVACAVCKDQVTRAQATVPGKWGGQILTSIILGWEKPGFAKMAEYAQLLENTGFGEGDVKSPPALCRLCTEVAYQEQRFHAVAQEQYFVKMMSDEERREEFKKNTRRFSLWSAIKRQRAYLETHREELAAQAAELAAKEAERSANEADSKQRSDRFNALLGRAAKPSNGKGGGRKGGGNRGRWDNND